MAEQTSTVSAAERLSQRQGELSLRASILDALGEAVVAADGAGRVIYWNAAAEGLYGWSRDEALGRKLTALLPAEGVRGDAISIIRHLREGRNWAGEFFVRHRSGRAFPIHATTTPVRDPEGRIIGMVGVAWDLSAHRSTEQALRESEQRLELVHRATVSVIWEWDVRSHEMRWNEAIADSFGYAREEVEETVTWWEDRIHPDDRDRVTRGLWETLSEGRRFWTDEYRFRTGDGTYATIFDRAYVATDDTGRPVRVVGTMLDLTERRRGHEAARLLSQAGMLLDLSMDYESTLPGIARLAASTVADSCMLLLTGPGTIEHVVSHASNPRAHAILEALAARIRAEAGAPPLMHRVLHSGEPVLLARITPEMLAAEGLDDATRAAAQEMDLASLALAPMIARGRTVGVVGLARSSEAPRLTPEDLHVAEELGRRIGVAVDSAHLFQTAELAKRAKSDFLSVISHELRTPLTAVLGYADLLEGEISGSLNEKQKQQVARIRAGSDRLLHVIEGILSYTRLETGREQVQVERKPLRAILDYVADIIRPQAAEKGIRFTEDLTAAPEEISVDVTKLNQVLLSLLTNAVKFSVEGDVGLRVTEDGGDVLFDVSDNGPGIHSEHIPHVFNPFWQAEEPEIRRSGGAGLGLSVARRLTRLMGGDLVVLDSSAHGTTFRARIPVSHGP